MYNENYRLCRGITIEYNKKGGQMTTFYCVYYTTKTTLLQFLILLKIMFILNLNYIMGDRL